MFCIKYNLQLCGESSSVMYTYNMFYNVVNQKIKWQI